MPNPDGAIYVGVLPDFGGFEPKMRAEATRLGKAFAEHLSEALGRVLPEDLTREVRGAAKKAEKATPPVKVAVQADTADVDAKLRELGARKVEVTAKVDADTKAAQVQIDRLTKQQAKLTAKVDADDSAAKATVDALEARKVSIQARVDADTAVAAAKLRELDRQINGLNNRSKVRVDVDTDRASGVLRKLNDELGGGIRGFGGLAAAGAALGPEVIPPLLGAAGAAAALGVTLGGAFAAAGGVGLLAFHGLGTAVSALADVQDQASKASATLATRQLAAAGAADQVRQAQAGLSNTIADAASATLAASARLESAERELGTAQSRERDVQLALTQARKDAAQQMQDLAAQVRGGSISEQEAVLALERAQERLNVTNKDARASTFDKEEARVAVERATFALDEQRRTNKQLADEKAKSDRAGIAGSKLVLDAQKNLKEAQNGVLNSEQAVTRARQEQADTERRNDFQIAQARQAIVSAQRAVQTSAIAMSKAASPALDKLQQAMANLSPEGQHFARFLFSLRPELQRLQAVSQKGLFPGLEAAIHDLAPLEPSLERLIGGVSRALGAGAQDLAKALAGPEVQGLLDQLANTAPGTLQKIIGLGAQAAKAVASIFTAASPAGSKILDDLSGVITEFTTWASSPQGKAGIASFFTNGVKDLEAFGRLAGGIFDVIAAFLGAGKGDSFPALLDHITGALHRLADMIRNNQNSPQILAAIALAFGALKVISLILGPINSIVASFGEKGLGGILVRYAIAPIISGIGAALGALSAPVLIVIGAVLALGAAFYVAYTRSQTFRDLVNRAIGAVGDFFVGVWTRVLHPTLDAFGQGWVYLYHGVIHPILTLIEVGVDILWAAVQVTFGLMQIGLILLSHRWDWLWSHGIRQTLNLIKDGVELLWSKVEPVLIKFGNFLTDEVAPAIRKGADAIGQIWDGIKSIFAEPISWVIDTVLNNGLLAAYNEVARTFGVKPDNVHINNPFAASQATKPSARQQTASQLAAFGHADGGPIRGPGTGTSDDIPIWASNGEFMIRAKAVQALGVPFLEILNRADQLNLGGDPSGMTFGRPRFAGGGLIQTVKEWLPAVDPLPYRWGAVGPSAYDCSGLVGEVWARLTGHPSYHRYMTTASNMRSLGFQPGRGTFTIGVVPGVHTAGNLAGLPFEAASTNSGIFVGSGAQSVDRFPQQWFLPQMGNSFVSAGGSGGGSGGFSLVSLAHAAYAALIAPVLDSLSARVPGVGLAADLAVGAARTVAENVISFDEGGWLRPGYNQVVNDTGEPEAILNPRQWAAMVKLAANGPAAAGRAPINIYYPPTTPVEQALLDAQARADLVGSF